MPEAGQIVGGRYRLVRPLGEGGMATVWAAEHLTMGNIVALKLISQELLQYDVAIARFNREARAAAKLRSPYVVQLFDHDVDPVLGPYIAMELLEGESLADRLDRERILPRTDLCRILLQVGKGLARAHAAGIVHRDIKPENIFLVVDDDGEETAKVLDFGVAKADSPLSIGAGKKTAAGTLLGTLNYMSPEQAQCREVSHLSDLWSLGVIAFEALVGRRPFEDEAPGAIVLQICAQPMPVPSAVNPSVPPGFDQWFAQACNRDPAKRFGSPQELAQSLAHVCDADELSLDDMLPVSLDEPDSQVPTSKQVASPQPSSKRRVLQLVDSTAPPPPLASESEEFDLEVDFETEAEPEYFVTHGPSMVGPVTCEALRSSYRAGNVPAEALLWTAGWPAWRAAAEVFRHEPRQPHKQTVPNLALVGPRALVPPAAPPIAPRKPQPAHPASPVTSVRATPGKLPPKEPSFYLSDGALVVGPVRAGMLRRGLDESRVPDGTMAWTDGWDEWRPVAELRAELEAWKPAPVGLLRNRSGIECVGMKTRMPPKAPSLSTAGTGGRSG